jgi:hypothetical protein
MTGGVGDLESNGQQSVCRRNEDIREEMRWVMTQWAEARGEGTRTATTRQALLLCQARQDQAYIDALRRGERFLLLSVQSLYVAEPELSLRIRLASVSHAMNRREVYCPPSHWLC